MPYASVQDLRNRYPEKDLRELTSETGEVIDDDVLSRVLGDASDEIDSYLIGRYVLPLAQPPRVLTRYACEIAYYLLLKSRPQETVQDARDRYDAAVKFFARVAKGDIQLGLDSEDHLPPQSSGPTVITTTDLPGSRQFSRETLRGL